MFERKRRRKKNYAKPQHTHTQKRENRWRKRKYIVIIAETFFVLNFYEENIIINIFLICTYIVLYAHLKTNNKDRKNSNQPSGRKILNKCTFETWKYLCVALS